MKKTIYFLAFSLIALSINAQNYQINFTGSGESSNVESVLVKNLTQGTELSVNGTDILNLVGSVGINDVVIPDYDLQTYPNPMKESIRINFFANSSNDAIIEIIDYCGSSILLYEKRTQIGNNAFKVTGLSEGVYIVNITTGEKKYSKKIVSINKMHNPKITFLGIENSNRKVSPRSIEAIVQMQYNDGDRLLFKGVSGDNSRIQTLIPTGNINLDFEFVECFDNNSNNYSVVTIGNQTWMAENLRYLPQVDNTSSSTIPSYFVYGYNGINVNDAKNNIIGAANMYNTYGVLYNWVAAEASCPVGWHLPSDDEWNELRDYAGGQAIAGGKLKGVGLNYWNIPNEGAINEFGFTALPGGMVSEDGATFDSEGSSTVFWTDESNEFYINYSHDNLNNGFSATNMFGYSVRCIMD